ncbi:MAG: hypothetical protein CMO80_05945 [Verrucomicrobiales bacterium]|nr:hypothetical protein [Verrucomicrobiales bacterium]
MRSSCLPAQKAEFCEKYNNAKPMTAPPMLFDLKEDLGEVNQLASQQTQRLKKLLTELTQ